MSDALRSILPIAGWSEDQLACVSITHGSDPVLPTPYRIGETAAATQAAVGLAAAQLWTLKGGASQSVTVNTRHATAALRSGKYLELDDAYKSIFEAFTHAGANHSAKVKVRRVGSSVLEEQGAEACLACVDGILVPGGFGERGVQGKIDAIRWAYTSNRRMNSRSSACSAGMTVIATSRPTEG